MSSIQQTGAADEQPTHDRPFAAVAALMQAWQAAEHLDAAPAPALPAYPSLPPEALALHRAYTRGLADGATIQTEEHERVAADHRLLRAHLRNITFEIYYLRYALMQPTWPRRGMIERCQALIETTQTLVNRSRECWPWVDTRGIDNPAPFATEKAQEGAYAPPWREAQAQASAAYDALRALTTPTGPRTPGYQERKHQLDAIRDAALRLARAEHEYGRQRGQHGD